MPNTRLGNDKGPVVGSHRAFERARQAKLCLTMVITVGLERHFHLLQGTRLDDTQHRCL